MLTGNSPELSSGTGLHYVFVFSTADNPAMAMTDAALQAGKTCGSLLVQILAFFSIYAFFDVVVAYLGARVGIELSLAVRLDDVML